ncbi:MAG: ArsR/SmtB family transcription factor [Gemmatimonadaceae bacterium]
MDSRAVRDRLHAAWADTARALASPRRIEILDLLAQAERSVEVLAREMGLTVNNTSSHLAVLKAARLVETRREAQFVFYRVADDSVVGLLRQLQAVTRQRLHEVDHLARTFFESGDAVEAIDARELRRRLRAGEVTLIDVRPPLEYEAGHIAGAMSIPLDTLDTRVRDLPANRPVVAYCRGPYCVMALEAVERLRRRGVEARRFPQGVPDWRRSGLPVATGPQPSSRWQGRRKA